MPQAFLRSPSPQMRRPRCGTSQPPLTGATSLARFDGLGLDAHCGHLQDRFRRRRGQQHREMPSGGVTGTSMRRPPAAGRPSTTSYSRRPSHWVRATKSLTSRLGGILLGPFGHGRVKLQGAYVAATGTAFQSGLLPSKRCRPSGFCEQVGAGKGQRDGHSRGGGATEFDAKRNHTSFLLRLGRGS